ncbi:MAG: hypothetical protein WD648_08885 [Planctomycetaceae bacterium]
MPTEQTESFERLTFEGPLTLTQAVLIGCILAVLAYWTLFRVPKQARRKWAPLLLLLRLSAIAIVVWMLAGPVHVTTYRHLTPKSLAVINDVSESMSVFDPPDQLADMRWKALDATNGDGAILAACDGALAATATARDSLEWILRSVEQLFPPERRHGKLATAGRAAASAADSSDALCRLLEQNSQSGAELLDRAKEIAAGLKGAGLSGLDAIVKRSQAASFALEPDEINQLEGWQQQLAQSARSLGRLSDDLARQVAANATATPAGKVGNESLSRRDKVKRLLAAGEKSWLSNHDSTARIRHYTFDSETTSVGPDATSHPEEPSGADKTSAQANDKKDRVALTNLSSALERINRDSGQEDIEEVLLITDGRHNDPKARDPRDVAKLLGGIPVNVLPVGSSEMRRDLVLHHVDVPTTVVQGDQVVVEAIISAFGCEGETVAIDLTEKGAAIDHQEIDVASMHRDYHIRLVSTPKDIGRHEYALTIAPLDGEVAPDNNAAEFGVDVVDATLKILLADDFPRWEYRYLVNLFERDERIEYDQILFHPTVKASGELKTTGQLPRDVDGWARYRLAILGDLTPALLDDASQRALKEFVSARGGTVIVIAGAQSMPQAFRGAPLGDLIPVSPVEGVDPSQGYRLELSAEGKLTPSMQLADEAGSTQAVWDEMSRQCPVYSLSNYCAPKPTARTLIHAVNMAGGEAGGDAKAFLCWQTVGRGRIVYMAAPAVYQLRLKHGDRYHHRFWGQLIRWAVARDLAQGSKTVKLATDRTRVAVGDTVQIVASLSDMEGRPLPEAQVRIEAAVDERPVSLLELAADPKIPGRFLGEYAPADAGTLTLQAYGNDVTQLLQSEGFSDPVRTSLVVDPMQSTETEDTRTNTPLLRQIAKLTGGQLVSPTAVEQLIRLTNLDPAVHEEIIRAPVWNRWSYLWLVVGVLTLEWTIRKKTGLP